MRILGLSILLSASSALAAPGIVPVQGYLTTTEGTPVDGDVAMTFRLYPTASDATAFFTEAVSLSVVGGRFASTLGATQTLELALFAQYADTHLTFQLAGDTESARVRLGVVPYAAFAHEAGTLGGERLEDVLAQIPKATDIESAARGVCFDAEPELTAVLDDNYKAASYVPAWDEITGVPAGLADGDDSLTQAQVEGFARGVCFDAESELTAVLDDNYRAASYVPAWGEITGIPADLADGDDSLTQAQVEGFARGVCFDTEAELTAALDDDYTYRAGAGLALLANSFSIDEYAGGPLIPNARFESGITGWTIDIGSGSLVPDDQVPDAAGGFAFRNSVAQVAWIASNVRRPVRAAQSYRVSGKFRRVDGNVNNTTGVYYLAVRFFDAAGNDIAGDGTWAFYAVSDRALAHNDSTWHAHAVDFGENARAIPTGARTMTVGAILNYGGGPSGNRLYEVTDLQIRAVTNVERTNGWRAATPLNSWVNYGAGYNPLGYSKDASGNVHLRGLVRNGVGQHLFTLPAGFLPEYRTLRSGHSNTGLCRIDVLANGEVHLLDNCSTAWTSVDGIVFPARS